MNLAWGPRGKPIENKQKKSKCGNIMHAEELSFQGFWKIQ